MKRRKASSGKATVLNDRDDSLGKCRSCGKETKAVRCPSCHTKMERWLADDGEPKGGRDAYAPRNRWEDFGE